MIKLQNVRLTYHTFGKPNMTFRDALDYLRSYYGPCPPRFRMPLAMRKAEYIKAVDALDNELNQLKSTNDTQAERLQKYQQNVATEVLDRVRTPGATSEEFRKQPNKRWIGSYTQKVVGGLKDYISACYFHTPEFMNAAIDLLTHYHSTMHVVYEERDQARRHRDEMAAALKNEQARVVSIKASTFAARYGTGPTPFVVNLGTHERAELNRIVAQLTKDRDAARIERDEACEKAIVARNTGKHMETLRNAALIDADEARRHCRGLRDQPELIGKQAHDIAELRMEIEGLTKERDVARIDRDNAMTQRDRCAQMEEDRREELAALRRKVVKAVLTRHGFEDCA